MGKASVEDVLREDARTVRELFSGSSPAPEPDAMTVRSIPLGKLIENPRNTYGVRDVEALADSIELNGQLEPLIVYPYGSAAELYRLISGHRRLAALRLLKAETALCRVVSKPESGAQEDLLIIHANAQRVKTPGELTAEIEKTTAALMTLKKQGVEIPGRLRDHVAEALGISPTALARKKVIRDKLAVPGFKQAWEAGKLPEASAYELAQLPADQQYEALDLLIDDGIGYERVSIKDVRRIKRKLETGESTKQDLHVEAEKRGIRIKDEDFSPLLAELVAEALSETWQNGLRTCRSKAEGLEHLHRFGFSHASHYGSGVCYDSDPQALTITQPIRRRIKWSDVWELLALVAMQQKAEPPAPEPRLEWREPREYEPPVDGELVIAEAAPEATLAAPARAAEGVGPCAKDVHIPPATCEAIVKDYLRSGDAEADWFPGVPQIPGRYLCLVDMDRAGIPENLHEQMLDWGPQLVADGSGTVPMLWTSYGRPVADMFDVVGWWPLPKRWSRSDGLPGEKAKVLIKEADE